MPGYHFDENGMIVFDVPEDQPKKNYKGRIDEETGMFVFDEVPEEKPKQEKKEEKKKEAKKQEAKDAKDKKAESSSASARMDSNGMIVFDVPEDQPKKNYKARMDEETGMFVFDEVPEEQPKQEKKEEKKQEKKKDEKKKDSDDDI